MKTYLAAIGLMWCAGCTAEAGGDSAVADPATSAGNSGIVSQGATSALGNGQSSNGPDGTVAAPDDTARPPDSPVATSDASAVTAVPATGTQVTTAPGAETSPLPTGPSATASDPNPSSVIPFSPASSYSALRKIKTTLTGLPPTDAEAQQAQTSGGLADLINAWMQTPQFDQKMITFFQNAFQQSSLAQLDFEFQLRKRPGAFDLAYNIFGDDAFPLLFQNMKESFARTCLQLIAEGRPFSEVLTTQRFMMTTALKSLYMQIEMPYDIHDWTFKFNQGMRPPIEETLDPNSPNYLVFGYAAPTTSTADRVFSSGTCAGDTTKVAELPGNTLLFQILLGSVPRDSSNNFSLTNTGCMEHAAKPYFTANDLSDWQMVTITGSGTPLRSFDLPALRESGATLSSRLPRVSFFTTPAFLAVWNTNDSNQHRVTANQALLVALGQGFTRADAAIPTPPNVTAVDGQHAVDSSTCYGCHKSLDPMRQFFSNFYSYNDQVATRAGAAPSFGFANVTASGTTLTDFGGFLQAVTDASVAGDVVSRFALEMTQKLCFFANSYKCETTDPEMRRVAHAFENSAFDFHTLVRELFSSPLVTYASETLSSAANGTTISVARRQQLCALLSLRLERADLCEIEIPTPTNATSAINRLAGALPVDSFSRGSEFPVTAAEPNLFYRAASELVCEAIAGRVVDTAGGVYSSDAAEDAIADMVSRVMGVPAGEATYAGAVQLLTAHYTQALAQQDVTAALRSTFSAACQAPTTLSLGI